MREDLMYPTFVILFGLTIALALGAHVQLVTWPTVTAGWVAWWVVLAVRTIEPWHTNRWLAKYQQRVAAEERQALAEKFARLSRAQSIS